MSSREPEERDGGLAQLAEYLRAQSTVSACSSAPCTDKQCAGKMAAPMWSPSVFAGGIGRENVTAIYWAVFDLDDVKSGALDAFAVRQNTDAIGYILYSGHSHRPPAHQSYRLVLSLSREVLPHEWPGFWAQVVKEYKIPADPACKDPTRRYFVPTAQPETAQEFEVIEGAALDVDDILKNVPAHLKQPATPAAPRPTLLARAPISSKPQVSFDLGVVKDALKKWGSGDEKKDKRARAVHDGAPWAAAGARDSELVGLVGQIVGRFPSIPDEALELLLTPSAVATAARDRDEPADYWLVRARAMVERFRPGAEEFAAENAARKEAAKKLAERTAEHIRRRRMEGRERVALIDVPGAPPRELRQIHLGVDTERVVDEAEQALGEDFRVFCAAGGLVRLVRGGGKLSELFEEPDSDLPQMQALGQATLGSWLSSTVRWIGAKGKPVEPPNRVTSALMEHGAWPHVPRLQGFAEAPVFRQDGSLVDKVGYDERTGLYLVDRIGAGGVPEAPTDDDIDRARDLLLEIVADFPFETLESRSVWVAAVLTPFAKSALPKPGLSPLFLVDANAAGVGKTKLVDVVALICTGRALAKMSNTADEEEMRKALVAIALAGRPLVVIDNADMALGSPALDSALTAGTVSGRLLGATKMVDAPMRCTWFATGNNLQLRGDTERRTLPIRLVSPLEHPENRGGFKHPHLERWVQESRAAIVGACLTVLRGFFQAGRPRHAAPPLGSFEAWQDLVCACVAWLGLPAPEGARRPDVYAPGMDDLAREVLDYFEQVSEGGGGMTISEFLSKITNQTHPGKTALQDLCASGGGQVSAARVGKLFTRFKDRNLGGKCLLRRPAGGGVLRWSRIAVRAKDEK